MQIKVMTKKLKKYFFHHLAFYKTEIILVILTGIRGNNL